MEKCVICGADQLIELRMLKGCRHIYCIACLGGYLQHNQVQTGEKFTCPHPMVCRNVESMPVGGAAMLPKVGSLSSAHTSSTSSRMTTHVSHVTAPKLYTQTSTDTTTARTQLLSNRSMSGDGSDRDYPTGGGSTGFADPTVNRSHQNERDSGGHYTQNHQATSSSTGSVKRVQENSEHSDYQGKQQRTHDNEFSSTSSDQSQVTRQKSSPAFCLTEVKGDIFKGPPTHSLANCISADVNMGKGIITAFKKHFGGQQELIAQGKGPGDVAVLHRGSRYVYYLVTKERYFEKPTIDKFRSSLLAMCEHCVNHGVKHLAMPRIGCGLDGLKWPMVKDMIIEIFEQTDVHIYIYS